MKPKIHTYTVRVKTYETRSSAYNQLLVALAVRKPDAISVSVLREKPKS